MGTEEFIAIPHFINPQLFWYHKVDGQNPEFIKLQRIEESVQSLFTAKQSSALCPYRPQVGEVVAVAFVSWNKYIRARVEHIAKFSKIEDEYIVWALDYGFPFQTKLCYVRKLPDSYTDRTDYIRLGAIANVIPAELDFDFVTTSSRLVCKQSWSQRAVELLERVTNDAASISFIELFSVERAKQTQHFGDLKIINHSGDEFLVSDCLIKMNYAVKCVDNFREKLANLQTDKIPCWETNSNDVKIIENKLNTLNMNYAQGKFDLSGSLSESSCDTFSKQKVIDWCERNQNLTNKNVPDTNALCPTSALDATDISFDDSVSVKNYKHRDRGNSVDESLMGYAGALHESRRKKYDGKRLPPKPAMEVFQVIPEKKQNDKDENLSKSGASDTSEPSRRAKALIELRKNHQGMLNTTEKEETPHEEIAQMCISTNSEVAAAEFLETCKKKNASARLEKLKELRKRRVEDNSNSTVDGNNSAIECVEENCGSISTTSSRQLRLKQIREKHSKQIAKQLDRIDAPTDVSFMDDQSQTESKISAHAAKLISMRKKIKDKYSQSSQQENHAIESNSYNDSAPIVQSHKTKGYKMPQHSQKFNKLEFSNASEDYFNSSVAKPELKSQPLPSTASNDIKTEEEKQKLREIIQANPFHSMTMVPAGFDVTKLVKRNDEETHWHTKKTTLNDSFPSNDSGDEFKYGGRNSNRSFGEKKPIARRTEDVEQQNFRLTRSRKERKRPGTDGKSNVKHLLDLSLNDSDCPPAITPVVVFDKSVKVPTGDLLLLNDSDELDTFDKFIDASVPNEPENALDVSKTASSDSFLKFVRERSHVKDTSREQLLESHSSNDTVDESFHFLSVDGPEKVLIEKELQGITAKNSSSSSISSSSFTKLESTTQKGKELTAAANDQDRSYEASSSSGSSGSVPKVEVVTQVPIKRPFLESSSSSSSVAPNEKEFSVRSDEKPLIKSSELIKFPIPTTLTSLAQPTVGTVNAQSVLEGFSTKVIKETTSPSASSLKSRTPIFSETSSTPKLSVTPKHLPELSNEASLKTNYIQHLVLAHCNVKVTPIERMTSALFSPEIHREMELMRLTKMYRIQSFSWAHLVRGNSFFVINAPRSGKTWCYLPPLCSMLSFRLESNCLPDTYGPVAVIIAPSSVQVESISRHCRRLLASTKTRVTIVPSYAYRNAEEVKIELHNGCGVLVITPASLQRLLIANESESLLNMERIQYVVVDDLDTMIANDDKFNETLLNFFRPAIQHQENGKVPFQMVVTSKRWSRRIIDLLRISNQPLLCIADYLEVAVYAKSKISIKLQSAAEKMAVMIKCLEKCSYAHERALVVCSTDDEVEMVHKGLLDAGYACLAYTSRMSVDYSNLVNEWKLKTICHQILVTTDSVLPELMIQNVWTLIHFSLPMSWTKFNFRFSTFLQNYENLLETDFQKPAKVPKSVVLIDEENNLQLPRLIEFMKIHSQLKYIPQDILNVASRVRAEREELRVNQGVQMCPKILEFGTCDQSNKCAYRHQLTKYDGPVEGLPTHGEVRLKILDVISPIHYTARILSYKNEDQWEIVRRSNEFTYFLMQLSLHFMNENSLVIHWPPKVNDMCVYKGDDIFHRCRLLEVPPIANEDIVKLINVKVKLVDSGMCLMCKSHDLLVIPEKFKDFPVQAVDIRLVGVVPFDSERAWDSRSRRAVKKWIMSDVTDKDCLQASINFVLMDTVWVDNVIVMELLKTIRGYAIKINVRRSLLLKDFALPDDTTHLVKQTAIEIGLLKGASEFQPPTEEPVEKDEEEQNLLEFSASTDAEVSHTDLPQVNPEPESVKQLVPISAKKAVSKRATEEWMQLRRDELLQVKVTQLHDPSKFYLRLLNKEEDLNDLEDMIRGHKRMPLEDPHPMQNCLASLNGRYCRAKIRRIIIDSAEGCVQARVFFCDHGLFANYPLDQLYSSSRDIIEYIPFQAICCKLIGIQVEFVGEEIQKIIQIENSVHLAYTIKEITAADDYEEGLLIHHYEIILYQCFGDKNDIQINKMLVERGLATYDDNSKHFLELETNVDFADFDFEQDKANDSFDFQSFIDRVKQQMDEEDDEELEEMYRSNSNAIAAIEDEKPKIMEITPDSSSEGIRKSPEGQLPTLRTLHKRPLTTWYETMCMIYLVIHAPDISDYHLEVTPKRLVFVANINGEQHMLTLDLLGYVEPEQLTHEIRGLNVVVRLVKSVYMKWPRLLQDPTKFSWLTYNFNAIDAMEVERLIEAKPVLRRRARAMSYSSSETSDSNPAETFTPIVNVDQLHDPMQEDFF